MCRVQNTGYKDVHELRGGVNELSENFTKKTGNIKMELENQKEPVRNEENSNWNECITGNQQ